MRVDFEMNTWYVKAYLVSGIVLPVCYTTVVEVSIYVDIIKPF